MKWNNGGEQWMLIEKEGTKKKDTHFENGKG